MSSIPYEIRNWRSTFANEWEAEEAFRAFVENEVVAVRFEEAGWERLEGGFDLSPTSVGDSLIDDFRRWGLWVTAGPATELEDGTVIVPVLVTIEREGDVRRSMMLFRKKR